MAILNLQSTGVPAVLLFLLLAACGEQPAEASVAFYHWKTALAVSSAERAYLDSLGARKLYVKFFDVDWEEGPGPIPLASLQADTARLSGLEIVPTVFITNSTVQKLSDPQVLPLVGQLLDKIQSLAAQLPGHPIREVQLDCDWTASTRERYFQLLRHAERVLSRENIRLTATIRLHQVRDFAHAGVPPVKRGTLMFYNMGILQDWGEENSILNLEAARPYLENFRRYPLSLDLALPAFGWGVLFREGRMIRLINDLHAADLQDGSRFVKLADNRFKVLKSTYLNSYYLYGGDLIRTETAEAGRLLEAADLLAPLFRGRQYTITFYHLDTTTAGRLPFAKLAPVIRKLGSGEIPATRQPGMGEGLMQDKKDGK